MSVPVTVEPDGKLLRGVAVPFGEHAILVERGALIAEVFDQDSIPLPPQSIPLLISHDRTRPPLGEVVRSAITPSGLAIEAELVDSDAELDRWRKRFSRGLMTGLSIAFRAGKPRWEKPPRRGMPPVKRIRGAEIEEVSVVVWPAYASAALTRLALRSAGDEELHVSSVMAIAIAQRDVDEVREFLAARQARRRSVGGS